MAFLKDILDNIRKGIGYVDDPYRVKEVPSEAFAIADVVHRDDWMVLFKKSDETGPVFEMVINKDVRQNANTVLSMFRSSEEYESTVLFCGLREVLPVFLSCLPELLNSKETLQDLCHMVRRSPTWSPAHIAASLGWADCFKHDQIMLQKDAVCSVTLVTPLHLAIKGNRPNVVQALVALGVKVEARDAHGDTVFHYAATTTKEIVQALSPCASYTSINDRNQDGHTPLHLACLTDKPDCVKELLRSGADVNITGVQCDLPLQCAVEASSPQCAKEIIDMYPNQLHTLDMKNGGTPLHWAKSPQCIEALIELGCILDAKNFQGDSALHVMVIRNRLPCIVTLLSHRANPSIPDANGDTPLHLAVKTGDLYLVQTLVVFGADVNWLNNVGESPRHLAATSNTIPQKEYLLYVLHAVGAQRCKEQRSGCHHGCASNGDYNGVVPEKTSQLSIPRFYDDLLGSLAVASALDSHCNGSEAGDISDHLDGSRKRRNIERRGGRVLCLDGGGIRGLILIQTLSVLESVLGAPLADFFDWMAGTSTGAILALALALGKPLSDCRCLYFRLKDKVFVGIRPYSPEPLEELLRKELGEETVMSDIKNTKVMVTGVLADRHPAELHLFRNYDSPAKILGRRQSNVQFPSPADPDEQLVWKAARASGAAPTYFRALGQFLDGGLIANNPTLDSITEIHHYNAALKATGQEDLCEPLRVIVSVGTGKFPQVSVNNIDIFRPDSVWNAAKMAMGVSAIGQLLVDKATETDGRVVERAQAWCSMIGTPYFRLNPPLSETVALDEIDNRKLITALWETMAYMYSRKAEMNELKAILTRS